MISDVALVFACTRLLFVALTVLLPLWRATTGAPPLVVHATIDTPATGTPFDAWNRWDARWYGDLAHLGYNLRGPHEYKNVAFFPLYPLLMRAAHDAVALAARGFPDIIPPGTLDPSYLLIGMLVSNLCALGALVYFYRYVRLDHGRWTARRAVTLLAVSPMSFYLFAAYSEGTFLLCVSAFFYALRLRRWLEVGLWGLLAGATRAPGAVLILPFAIAWAAAHPTAVQTIAGWLPSPRSRVRQLVSLRHGPWWRSASDGVVGAAKIISLDDRRRRADRYDPTRPSPFLRRVAGAGSRLDDDGSYPGRLNLSLVGQARGRADGGSLRLIGTSHAARDGSRPALAPRLAPRYPSASGAAQRALRDALPAALIPLGVILFMLYLSTTFGDALLFGHAQWAWQRTVAAPWTTLYASIARPLGDLRRGVILPPDVDAAQDLCYAAGGLFVTWRARRLLPRVEGAYLWLVWAIILSSPALLANHDTGLTRSDVLMSLPRLLLMLFPLCTHAALPGRGRLYPWLVGASTLALIVYTLRFLTGAWVA